MTLAVGPIAGVRYASGEFFFLPGFTFSLKEGTGYADNPLFGNENTKLRISGYWQGMWIRALSRWVFIDGGGTALRFPFGLALGISGGVLRQYIPNGEESLSIMITGITGEWNFCPLTWITITPRITTGMALYGWWNEAEGSMDGGPHFMVRPELCAFFRLLPFLSVGGGFGRHMVAGEAQTARPIGDLSSWIFTLQFRVGD